jgi:hypothetical protein
LSGFLAPRYGEVIAPGDIMPSPIGENTDEVAAEVGDE